MMPVIRISDGTFKNLQQLAEPLVDTPSTVIDRLIEAEMKRVGKFNEKSARDQFDADVLTFDSGRAPGLTHTKLLACKVGGQEVENPKWAGVLVSIIENIKARGVEGTQLVQSLAVPATIAVRNDQGYKYIEGLRISIQGQSAQDAWAEISRLADKYSIPVEITFQWRDKPGAEYPGRVGYLTAGSQ